MLTPLLVATRVVANPVSNVFQKQLAQRGANPIVIIAATIQLDHDGRLVLYRMAHRRRRKTIVASWQTATAQLPPDAVAKVLDAVEANALLGLAKEYHANVADGTQWVLWVRQGEREKAVHFNNHFPDAIVRFAERFDTIVAESVGSDLRWWGVPVAREREDEKELWQSNSR